MPNSRDVVAFIPQHTTTKSRVMAIVDKGDGLEIEAIATVDQPHEARALCNLLNVPDAQPWSGLWQVLDSATKANLERAGEEMIDKEDDRYLAPLFVHVIEDAEDPSAELAAMADIAWANLFKPTDCPSDGCENCSGCAAGQCSPGGSCECLTEEIDDCCCACLTVGPRWAAVIYESLHGLAQALFEHAQQQLWGVDELTDVPDSLTLQSPRFFVRLAQTCATLAKVLASGRIPIPQTIAELIMLEEAARDGITFRVGGKNHDVLDIDDLKHLPEGHGDLDMDALWMFQFTDSDWEAIRDHDGRYEPGSMNRIFDLLPEAAEFPRDDI